MVYAKEKYQIDQDTFRFLSLGALTPAEIRQIVGKFLRSEREFYHIKKLDLARAYGITSNRLTRIESGSIPLAAIQLLILAFRFESLGADPTNINRLARALAPEAEGRF